MANPPTSEPSVGTPKPANDDWPGHVNDNHPHDPRSTMGIHGGWIDEGITIFTGKALPGQGRRLRFSGPKAYLISTAALAASVGFNLAFLNAMEALGWVGLLGGPVVVALMVVTVGRLRNQQVTWAHHATHGVLMGTRAANKAVTFLATVLSVSQNEDDYGRDHVKGHHKQRIFTTAADPDAAFLVSLGFRPGMKKAEARRLFWHTMVSPRYHARFTFNRLKSALWDAQPQHRLTVAVYLLSLAGVSALLPWWISLLAIWLPLGPLYAMSALLQFATEHRWMVTPDGPRTRREYAQRCAGRFCGEAFPKREGGRLAYRCAVAIWVVKMALIHAPMRVGCLVGDLPVHDAHHLYSDAKLNAPTPRDLIFARQASIDAGDPVRFAERELWGVFAMLDWVFDGLEAAAG